MPKRARAARLAALPAPQSPDKGKEIKMLQTGKALILRTCDANGCSHNGFQWPGSGAVTAPDWQETSECGNGLHGLLNGEGSGALLDWSPDATWFVAEINSWIDLGGKVKFPAATVLHKGDRMSATAFMQTNGYNGAIVGGTATAGDFGTATAGYRGSATAGVGGTATAGDYGTATAGDDGSATAGYYGTATAGDDGTAMAGDDGTATAGDDGTATAGNRGTAMAGVGGTILIRWFDKISGRYRIATGYIGEDNLQAGIAYRVDDRGSFFAA